MKPIKIAYILDAFETPSAGTEHLLRPPNRAKFVAVLICGVARESSP